MHSDIEAAGASLVAISPQQLKYSRQVAKKHGLSFPILTDSDNEVATKFGLTHSLPDDLKTLYDGFGIDLVRFNGNDLWTLPLPARFIIDGGGIIRDVAVDPDYTKRPEPSEIAAIVNSLDAGPS